MSVVKGKRGDFFWHDMQHFSRHEITTTSQKLIPFKRGSTISFPIYILDPGGYHLFVCKSECNACGMPSVAYGAMGCWTCRMWQLAHSQCFAVSSRHVVSRCSIKCAFRHVSFCSRPDYVTWLDITERLVLRWLMLWPNTTMSSSLSFHQSPLLARQFFVFRSYRLFPRVWLRAVRSIFHFSAGVQRASCCSK